MDGTTWTTKDCKGHPRRDPYVESSLHLDHSAYAITTHRFNGETSREAHRITTLKLGGARDKHETKTVYTLRNLAGKRPAYSRRLRSSETFTNETTGHIRGTNEN